MNHAYSLFLIFFFLALSPTDLQADIYCWTAENAVQHYSDVKIPDSWAAATWYPTKGRRSREGRRILESLPSLKHVRARANSRELWFDFY